MARNIHTRYVLTGSLVAVTPLHVGQGSASIDSDMPMIRDGQGRLYIPGTTFAGLLREYLRRYFGQNQEKEAEDPRLRKMLGFQDGNDGWASQLVVEDAVVESSSGVEVRDHVGIDRHTGTAAERMKFDREVLPVGTRIPLRVSLDCADPQQSAEGRTAVESLVAALSAGGMRIGGAKSRGLGKLRLNHPKLAVHDFASTQGILAYLHTRVANDASAGGQPTTANPACIASPPVLRISLHWRAVGALMVKAAIDGGGADVLPLMSHVGTGLLPVIPGSTLKGPLRAEAERILRTIFAPPPIDESREPNPKKRFSRQLSQPELELVHWLFGQASQRAGATRDGTRAPGSSAATPVLGYSALRIDDCFPRAGANDLTPLPIDIWRAISEASVDPCDHAGLAQPAGPTTELARLLERHGLPHWTSAFHVAIDRWTGGASDGMFFKVLEPHCVPWEPITCELDLSRIPGQLQLSAMALLLLVLDRMADGALAIGCAGNRGMGEIAIDGVEFRGSSLQSELQWLANARYAPFSLANIDSASLAALRASWKSYIERPNFRGTN